MNDFIYINSHELRIAVSPFGAALAGVWLRGYGTSLVLGLPKPQDYRNAPAYIGVIAGPIAGRVTNASVPLNGKTYQMDANTPPDCLHSGQDGFHNHCWEIIEHTDTSVTLALAMADGMCGLPGKRTTQVTYDVKGASLSVSIETTSDADTYVNSTNHAYWVLDETGSLEHHLLTVNADKFVETGADLIPTGHLPDVQGTTRDFRAARCPVEGPALDGTSVLSGSDALRLESKVSGISLQVTTDQPAVVLYTGEHLPALAAREKTPAIKPFSAIAIEAQGLPDAPNHAHFPSILLRAGETRRQFTNFKLSTAGDAA